MSTYVSNAVKKLNFTSCVVIHFKVRHFKYNHIFLLKTFGVILMLPTFVISDAPVRLKVQLSKQ